MQHPQPTKHCAALVKEQREVLDEAARRYNTDWHVRPGKHNKVYLGDTLVTVLSHSHDTNNRARQNPAARLRSQIRKAMERKP